MPAQTQDSYGPPNHLSGTDLKKAQSSAAPVATSPGTPLLFYRPLPRRTGGQRFLRAFLWIAFALLVTPTLIKQSRRFAGVFTEHRRQRYGTMDPVSPHLPANVSDSCTRFADWSFDTENSFRFAHSASTSFDLPVDSDLLYLVSKGTTALAHGTVEISDSGDAGSDVVKVEISALYDLVDVFDLVKVCLLQSVEGQDGVGIFAPPRYNSPRGGERIQFHIKARLPAPSGNSPVFIKRFETHLPIFVHHVTDLQDSVFFDMISLKSSNVPLKIDSLASRHGIVTTSNGPIEGFFNSSGDLELRTSNAFIKTEVNLINDNVGPPSKLTMRTSNSPIGSNVSLVSTAEDGTGGSFHVDARTSNSPLAVRYPAAPVDSVLQFFAHTSNSPAHATLHPTFEGGFELKGSRWFGAVVNADSNAEDPAGRGRERVVVMSHVGQGAAAGNVRWGAPEQSKRGWAELTTSNMGVTLNM